MTVGACCLGFSVFLWEVRKKSLQIILLLWEKTGDLLRQVCFGLMSTEFTLPKFCQMAAVLFVDHSTVNAAYYLKHVFRI